MFGLFKIKYKAKYCEIQDRYFVYKYLGLVVTIMSNFDTLEECKTFIDEEIKEGKIRSKKKKKNSEVYTKTA